MMMGQKEHDLLMFLLMVAVIFPFTFHYMEILFSFIYIVLPSVNPFPFSITLPFSFNSPKELQKSILFSVGQLMAKVFVITPTCMASLSRSSCLTTRNLTILSSSCFSSIQSSMIRVLSFLLSGLAHILVITLFLQEKQVGLLNGLEMNLRELVITLYLLYRILYGGVPLLFCFLFVLLLLRFIVCCICSRTSSFILYSYIFYLPFVWIFILFLDLALYNSL